MQTPDERKEFTISETAKACGISRTTLIKLEECGFLKPHRINPATGYRYYDIYNIVEIGRYKRLQALGFTHDEITNVYHDHKGSEQFIESKRKMLRELQHFIYEYDLRHSHTDKPFFTYQTLPQMTCYCEDISSSSFTGSEALALSIYERVISEGIHIISDQPPLAMSDNWSALAASSPSACRLTVCIPVIPTSDQSNNVHLRTFPAGEAFLVSDFGSYDILPGLFSHLYEESSKRGLELTGPVRLIVLATNESTPDKYIFECIVPIKEQKNN